MSVRVTPAQFMGSAPAPLNGSSPWASRYASELRRVVTEHAELAPRSQQVHLGPSEIGVECDRQIVSKLLQLPRTNHVADIWPSFVGTAVHAALADAFSAWNDRHGQLRFVTEQRVTPHEDHAGTADLYDAAERAVVDHKCLGPTSMGKVRSPEGPPRHYVVQLLAYAHGYRLLGLPVDRVALAAYPRTSSSLDGLFVWERQHTTADDELLAEVFADMDRRKAMAGLVRQGHLDIAQVPSSPTEDGCYFCPFWRPEAALDSGAGCPGKRAAPPA